MSTGEGTFHQFHGGAATAGQLTWEEMRADYVRTARAKGLPEVRVVLKHALKNAFLPVLSYLGPAAAAAMTGSSSSPSPSSVTSVRSRTWYSSAGRSKSMMGKPCCSWSSSRRRL